MTRLLVLLFFASSVALAQPTCNYEGSQLEMNACAYRDFKIADDALNREYENALKKRRHNQEPLRAEQRAWIKRRDANCKPKRQNPGSNSTIDYFTCMQTMTEIRTLQLKQHLASSEGLPGSPHRRCAASRL